MKRQFVFLLLTISWQCFGQRSEFTVYDNGLIYSKATMSKLGIIVDSLNLKFRTCDLSHPYYSFEQGMGTKVKVRNGEALKLIEKGVSLESFKDSYPGSVQDEFWIIKRRYRDYEDKSYIEYSGLPFGWNEEPSISLADNGSNDKTTGWVVNRDKSQAFYFKSLKQFTLPHEYARLVQYVDCMIDTTATIYLPHAQDPFSPRVAGSSKGGEFVKWAEDYPGEPTPPDYDKIDDEKKWETLYDDYQKKYNTWDSQRLLHLDKQMKNNERWTTVLKEAAEDGLKNGNSTTELEFYVERYLSKETALQLKRSRRVVGMCSQDQSPRYHAMEICKLAAETTKWDIFLRSHLDIMNDRFERMTDGSYAWAGRKTYLKELEALDIPAVDLLLGTCLRVENVSENHYWSSIGRTGRALADAEDKVTLETRMLTMVKDEKLDPFNRLLMAYLFSNYAHNLDDKGQTEARLKDLESAMTDLPDFVKKVWKKN
jgi:hypothetical protein